MKARDEVRTRTLRMALTSMSNEEVAGSAARELSDEEIQRVLAREAKRRREAAEAFEQAGRHDQAAAERAEDEVLAGYLPAQLGDDELPAIVAAGDRRDRGVRRQVAGAGHEGRHAPDRGPCRGRPGRRGGPPPARGLTRLSGGLEGRWDRRGHATATPPPPSPPPPPPPCLGGFFGLGELIPVPLEKNGLSGGTPTKLAGVRPRAACRNVICQVAPGALSPNICAGHVTLRRTSR